MRIFSDIFSHYPKNFERPYLKNYISQNRKIYFSFLSNHGARNFIDQNLNLATFEEGVGEVCMSLTRTGHTKVTPYSFLLAHIIFRILYLICAVWICQNRKGHITYKLNSMTGPVLPSLIFPFHLFPSPMHPTRFHFCFFPSFHFFPRQGRNRMKILRRKKKSFFLAEEKKGNRGKNRKKIR